MGYLLKEGLKTLCGVNQWSYAVFWKIGCQNPKLLIWEECYYEPASCSGLPGKENPDAAFPDYNASWISAEAGDKVHLLVNKMMMDSHVNIVGEGLVGRVAFTGNHQWILSENYCGDSHPPEVVKEVCQQFSAGMQTIAVIPVLPHGVVQFGSTMAIMENLGFINDVTSLILQLGYVSGALISPNYEAKQHAPRIGVPLGNLTSGGLSVESNAGSFDSFNYVRNSDSHRSFSLAGNNQTDLQSNGSVFEASNINHHYQFINGVAKAEVIPSNSESWKDQRSASLYTPRSTLGLSSNSSPSLSYATMRGPEQKILSTTSSHDYFSTSNVMVANSGTIYCSDDGSVMCSGAMNNTKPITAGGNTKHQSCSEPQNEKLHKVEPSNTNSVDCFTSNSLLSDSKLHHVDNRFGQSESNGWKKEMGQDTVQGHDLPLSHFEGQIPYVSDIGYDDVRVQPESGDDLFDVLGADFKNKLFSNCWNSCLNNESAPNMQNWDDKSNQPPKKSLPSQGNSESGIFSSDHLLEAVVSTVQPCSKQITDDNVSCRTTLTNMSSASTPNTSLPYGRFGISDQLKGELFGVPKYLAKPGATNSCSLRNGPSKEESRSYSQGSSIYGSQISSWMEKDQTAKPSNSVSTGHSKKPDETGKSNRKRLKPGESPRPRPKDRQMIQDRVKELREIVPNGAKCSIDALLERTIKHMLFLQSVTKHADKLKQTGESKIISKDGGLLLKDNFEGGATWAYEVGSQSMVCPIIVEDLNQPRQMLVEMLCEERGLFLEIADIIRGLGLTILKGVMETKNDKIWARFSVEANRDVTRMEIFISLVRLLEQSSKGSAPQPNNISNDNLIPLDGQKSQAIAVGYSHEKDKANYFYSSINTSSSKCERYPHITDSQKLPVENDASACFRGNNTSNSFLRVACSGISGSLCLSDTGLPGIVCTCHGLYMSISKFAEHSGSCDVDPGNAVLLDSGETIAHWWKAFSSRTEIRVLEEQIGWDWPEGISVAPGVTDHPISSLSNNTILSNQISSSKASASYEHIYSKGSHSCRNVDHEEDIATRECSNSAFKNFMNNSHENLPHAVGQHVCGLPKSLYEHSEKASRSFTPTLDKIFENANSLPALSNPQYLKSSINGFSDGTKNSLIVEKPRVPSSIELRLGQPPQKSAIMDTKRLLASKSNLNGVHEASKVFFRDKLLQSNIVWQGSGLTPQSGDIYANPAERRGPIEFGHARGALGAYCATTNCWKDSSNINSEKSAGTLKEHGMDISTAPSSTNGDKEVQCDLNGLVGAAKSNIDVPNEIMGKSRTFNLVLGENSTAFQGKKLNHYMSADKSYGYEFLNSYWKISSPSGITHFNRDHVKPNPIVSEEMPLGLRSRNSDFVHIATSKLPQEKNYVIKKGLQYKSVEMPSAWNMMELSYRDNGKPGRGVQECEFINSPCKQSPVTFAPSTSQDPTQLSDSLRMPKYSQVGDMSRLPGCWMGNTCERFCTMKGRSSKREDLIRPSTEQLYLWGYGCKFTHNKKEHFSQGLPSAHAPEQCSSTAQANYLAGQCDLDGDNYGKLVNEDRSGAATRLLHPKLNTNFIFLKETAESFDKAASSMALKSSASCSFQWRDVPKNETGNCNLTRKEQETVSRSPLGCPAADVTKSISGFAPVVVPVKEYEVSNSSSGCSAPDVMQSSSEVNKKDCSATEVRNISCADSLIGDKGSRNVRSCSSDDALDSEICPEFYRSTSKVNLIKRESFKLVPREQSLSLIEEIRLQNSLQSKVKRSYTFHEAYSDRLQKFELTPTKKRKPTKWMMLDVSGNSSVNSRSRECSEDVGQNAQSLLDMQMQLQCDQGSPSNCADSIEGSGDQRNSTIAAVKWVSSGKGFKKVYHQEEQQKTNRHKSLLGDDTARASGILRKKGLRLNGASARPTEDRELFCGSAELTEKMTSLGGCDNSPSKSSFEKQMVRPTVCGKYGIISNGNPSKSIKFFPLSEVLKTTVNLADKSNLKAHNNKKLKYTSVKEKKISVKHVKQQVLGNNVLKSRANNCASHSSLSSDWDDDSDTASCSETSDSDFFPSYALQKCNNHSITVRKPEDKLKKKFREVRKRSLHELIFKGNSSEVVNSSFMKNSSSLCQTTSRCCREVMENALDGRTQTSETVEAGRCSEKHLPENSDMFCCVCRGSDKGEHNQLLQCNRSLLKGLLDEAKAVDNKNVSFYRRCMPHATSHVIIPGNYNECLQPEEVNCARTEGYKGRKRGVLHHHSRETNRNGGCLVPQEQLNAWLHIHQQRPQRKERPKLSSCNVESDCRKAYTRYKQLKSWKHLVVYKSGIHALGLYTSEFISQGAMVVEYVGEIVGLRVADRRESEYHSGKKLQHKSACYFFRIDKEHIIDATRKGGIARFVNHSCQPNCVAKVISVRTEKKVVFFAERDIYPGEEITYDYHFNHEDEGEKIPCFCNSNNCRRYLN